MVLLIEILLLVGIVAGAVRLATRPEEGMPAVEPDRVPRPDDDAPLTADDLVAYHLPVGLGYRKVDVDRLLDRVARQLPRAGEPSGSVDGPAGTPIEAAVDAPPISLSKENARG